MLEPDNKEAKQQLAQAQADIKKEKKVWHHPTTPSPHHSAKLLVMIVNGERAPFFYFEAMIMFLLTTPSR